MILLESSSGLSQRKWGSSKLPSGSCGFVTLLKITIPYLSGCSSQ